MQPWQSVLLILITLIVFGAGFYYDQIKKNTAIAYEDSLIKSQKPIVNKQESNTSNELQSSIILKKSSAWAETNILIKISQSNSHHTYLHKEAMKGKTFLDAVVKTLDKNPTAKEIILSPFINDIFTESESSIMQSLYFIVQDIELPTELHLIVRGHSGKASSLLTKVIIDTYKSELKNETSENPILPSLLKQIKKIRVLEENQLQLAEQIEEENENKTGQSIEEIALRSEIMQFNNEIHSHVVALKEIEKIHLTKKDPIEYLRIHSLANFGNVREFLNNIDRLKRMLVNQALEPLLKNEVTKNLNNLESALNQELAKGIENIKELSRTALKRKVELQKRLVDFEMKKNDIHSFHPRFKLLKSVSKQLNDRKSFYTTEFEKWQQAKGGLTFKKIP